MNKQKRNLTLSKLESTILGLCLLIIWILSPVCQADAADNSVESGKSSFQFTMEARLPENQMDQSKTYFDLRVQPGQVQDIQVDLVNLTQQELTLQVYATTAVTNNNGVIDYTILDSKQNDTLKYPFSEIAQVVNPEVVLTAKEQKTVNIQLSIPEEPFNGIILGGIFVTPKVKEAKSQKEKSQVTTQQTMVKGVRLSENDEPIEPKLEFLHAQAGQIGYRNVFQATLQNSQPIIIDQLNIKAAVYKKGNMSRVLYEKESKDLRMAPNSSFNYSVPLNSSLFEAGEYLMKLTVTSGERKWEFEQPLKVSVVEAEKFNQQIPEELLNLKSDKSKNNIGWLLGGFVFLSLIAILLWRYVPKWRNIVRNFFEFLVKSMENLFKGKKNTHHVKNRKKHKGSNRKR